MVTSNVPPGPRMPTPLFASANDALIHHNDGTVNAFYTRGAAAIEAARGAAKRGSGKAKANLPVENGERPARQSPTGPYVSGVSVGRMYEPKVFVSERSGGSARSGSNLDGAGTGRHDTPDDIAAARSRDEGSDRRSRPP